MLVSISHKGRPIYCLIAIVLGLLVFNFGMDIKTLFEPAYDSSTYIDRGDAYMHLGNQKAAADAFTAAINQRDINLHGAYERRAIARFELGDHEGASQDIDRAMEEDPRCCRGIRKRGTIKLHFNDYLGAVRDLSTAIKLDPTYIEAYKDRARAYEKLNNLNSALKDYDKAVSLGWQRGRINSASLVIQTSGLLGSHRTAK